MAFLIGEQLAPLLHGRLESIALKSASGNMQQSAGEKNVQIGVAERLDVLTARNSFMQDIPIGKIHDANHAKLPFIEG